MQPSPPGEPSRSAWEPFTFGGVAAFARAGLWRTALPVLLAGALLAWAAHRYLAVACFPAVDQAMSRLPPTGGIEDGRLVWTAPGVVELANTGFLRLAVNPSVGPLAGQSADVALELTRDTLTAQSLFGYWVVSYPSRLQLPLNQPQLEPLWAAWRPHLQVVLPTAFALLVLAGWCATALVLAPFLRFLAGLQRRAVTLRGCWKSGLVALTPAGLGSALALMLYASHGFRLPDLLIAAALAHLYAFTLAIGCVFALPRHQPPPSPFAPPEPEPPVSSTPQAPEPETPAPGFTVRSPSPFAAPRTVTDPENPFAVPLSPAPPAPPRPVSPPPPPARPATSESPDPLNPS